MANGSKLLAQLLVSASSILACRLILNAHKSIDAQRLDRDGGDKSCCPIDRQDRRFCTARPDEGILEGSLVKGLTWNHCGK